MAFKVVILSGGLSLERDVSLRSGRRVMEALSDRGHHATLLDLDSELVPTLAKGSFDAAFLTLHGKAGEDGTIQGLLELLGLPYTGPDAVASAIAWDKGVFKGMLGRAGLSTPPWVAVSSEAIRTMGAGQALDRIGASLGGPFVVKPAQGGASMGVRFVPDESGLTQALVTAFNYSNVALVERFIAGTEVAVSIIDDQPMPAVEIVPLSGSYDFTARYTAGATEFFAPARLDGATLDRCAELAVSAYQLAGARQITRADMIVDADGQPWLLELDTCPGMTDTSLLPMAAQAAGIDFAELCERLVRGAIDRAPVTV